MISRTHRFHGHNSLNYVYRHGKTTNTPQVSLKSAINNRRQDYRVAVVVSKKVNKSAVVRNRIRRKLYEAVRQNKDGLTKPYDIVLTVFTSDLALSPQSSIESLVDKLFKQAGLT